MTKKELLEELQNLEERCRKMEKEEWEKYHPGIFYASGWLEQWMKHLEEED